MMETDHFVKMHACMYNSKIKRKLLSQKIKIQFLELKTELGHSPPPLLNYTDPIVSCLKYYDVLVPYS